MNHLGRQLMHPAWLHIYLAFGQAFLVEACVHCGNANTNLRAGLMSASLKIEPTDGSLQLSQHSHSQTVM